MAEDKKQEIFRFYERYGEYPRIDDHLQAIIQEGYEIISVVGFPKSDENIANVIVVAKKLING